MRKYIAAFILIGLLGIGAPVYAIPPLPPGVSGTGFVPVSGAPSGACTMGTVAMDSVTGCEYPCVSSTWSTTSSYCPGADGSRFINVSNTANSSTTGEGDCWTNLTTDAWTCYNNGAIASYVKAPAAGPVTIAGPTAARTLTLPDANATMTYTVASGTALLDTSVLGSITSGSCTTAIDGTTGTGIATTDVIDWGFNGDPTGVTGFAGSANGMLTIIAYPATNHAYFKVCNNTASAITIGSDVTLNWKVRR